VLRPHAVLVGADVDESVDDRTPSHQAPAPFAPAAPGAAGAGSGFASESGDDAYASFDLGELTSLALSPHSWLIWQMTHKRPPRFLCRVRLVMHSWLISCHVSFAFVLLRSSCMLACLRVYMCIRSG
jgi:hypothetical protein